MLRQGVLRLVAIATLTLLSVALVSLTPGATSQGIPEFDIPDYRPLAYTMCFEDVLVLETKVPGIPVGCEVIDCCPGCPGPGPLDWRIRLEATPVDAMMFEFENLSPEAARQIAVEGNGRWDEDGRLHFGQGETVLRGLEIGPGGRLPVAIPRVAMDSAAIGGALGSPGAGPRQLPDELGDLELIVEQMLGPVVVNEYVLRYRFTRCIVLPPPDMIDLDNNTGEDNAVVFLDARTAAGVCVNDRIRRGSNLVFVGNMITNAACNSEVAVFADDDAVQLLTPVTTWTDASGDVLPADLTPDLWQTPVSVWIAVAGSLPTAQIHFAQANALFNTNHAGVGFNPTYNNVSGNPTAVATIGQPACPPSGVTAPIAGTAFYTPNQLNVYYVNAALTGYNCIFDRNIVVIGTTAQPASLAHEFGHAHTLAHVNTPVVDYNGDGIADFGTNNVMWGGGVGRTTFTEAQCFRMSLNPASVVNANGVRTTGPTRTCTDGAISPTCPWLAVDAQPN